MQTAAAIFKLVAVVAAGDDVEKAAGGAAVGVIIDRKEIFRVVESHAEWIPKARSEKLEFRPVGFAAKYISAFAAAADGGAVGSAECVVFAEIFAEADIEQAVRAGAESAEAVVREVAVGLKFENGGGILGAADAQDGIALDDEELAGLSEREAHGGSKALGVNDNFVRLAVVVGVNKAFDAIGFWPRVIGFGKVGVGFDDEDGAVGIDGDAGGSPDVGLLGEERDFEAGIFEAGRFGGERAGGEEC